MGHSLSKLAKRIACSGVLGCVALGWFSVIAKPPVLAATNSDITVSSSCSILPGTSEPLANSSDRQVRAPGKDSRRSTVLGLVTGFSELVLTADPHVRAFDSIIICISAGRSLPNDRGPPQLFS
jgi:hypothetical protein